MSTTQRPAGREYWVATGCSVGALISAVRRAMEEGFEPLGGVAVVARDGPLSGQDWAQAMTKEIPCAGIRASTK